MGREGNEKKVRRRERKGTERKGNEEKGGGKKEREGENDLTHPPVANSWLRHWL